MTKTRTPGAQLKPCPFCGEQPYRLRLFDIFILDCQNCECAARPTVSFQGDRGKCEAEWNRRPPPRNGRHYRAPPVCMGDEVADHAELLLAATEKLESAAGWGGLRCRIFQMGKGILSDDGESVADATIKAMEAAVQAIDVIVKLIREPEVKA